MKNRALPGAVTIASLLLAASLPSAAHDHVPPTPGPVGTWLLTVNFASGNPPPFKELLTLHQGGTVTETNVTLSAASGFLPPPLNLVGSDGQGSWRRLPNNKVQVAFTKLVMCGPASTFCSPGQEGQQMGYLRVQFVASIAGDALTSAAEGARSVLVLGPELGGPEIDFGPVTSTGVRLR